MSNISGRQTITVEKGAPLLAQGKRWDYFMRYQPFWLQGIRYRTYALALGIAGIFLLFTLPLLSVLAFAGAMYFYRMSPFYTGVASSKRRLIQLN
ncbi:hypothetical protein AUJ14_01125 [Candidatus Micrarchaeota archaeon CG1_02_55_22]|nr:MAG: hypothetical protein AUJ14_01125 [Candidatus Micrarchaeota archaeon CG1_02_55_22]